MERTLLCIEPDSATVAEIRTALSPFGFAVENIPNGEDAMEWGQNNVPALIVLSVEPRKVGYAICNKLKRSAMLRDVPLILISSEETLATFEQHRKLKSHADEYLLKPLDMPDLLAKIDKLIGLPASEVVEEIEEADSGDILIADSEEELAAAGNGFGAGDLSGAARSNPPQPPRGDTLQQRALEDENPFTTETFDRETQAAFAALEGAAPSESAPAVGAGGDVVDLRSLWSETELPPVMEWERAPKTQPPGQDEQAESEATEADETLIPPGPDEVRFDEAHDTGRTFGGSGGFPAPRDPQVQEMQARVSEAQSRAAELQSRIDWLESERQTLRKETEEARDRYTQTASFSKEREFLGLREIINKKEKDILDLRDQMDAKERQVLDHKDKIRELERARRDLEENTLGFERSLVAANEKVAELLQDRDKSGEREKAFKARLDDAHEELRKSRDEIEGLRKRLTQDEQRARGELERVRTELEGRLVEMDEGHRREMARLGDERAAAEAAVLLGHQTELGRHDTAHRAEVEALQRRLGDEQIAASERLQSEVQKIRREHEKAIAALRDEQATQLAAERQAYEALTEAKERDHRNEILGLRRRQEEELAAAEERRQRDIAEQEARRISELEVAEGRRRAELASRDEEQHNRITEIERRYLTEKTELSERHRAEHDQAVGRAARAEGELAARIQELDQAYRRVASLVADVDAARVELGNREVRLAQNRDRMTEMEGKVADYEEQIVRAYQRIKSDEKTTEKTRRALSVALALLDDRGGGAAAATGTGPHLTTGGGKPPVEDTDMKT
ncbi:MAG TPA: response regulator [Polyangia bacterium]|nr:response regulator [Polyangia bacterium]